MIESILRPSSVEKRPWEAFIAGFLFTIVAILLTLQLGVEGAGAGLLLVAFISIPAAPFFLNLFRLEEKHHGGNIFSRHKKLIEIFGFFFLAVILASSLVYVILPPETSAQLYDDQANSLRAMGVIKAEASAASEIGFGYILINNLQVLFLAFIFSFVFGAGAVWLIAWNATILGVLIGKIAENPVAFGSILVVKDNIATNYVLALPLTLIRLLPHGILEFGGYFFGAIAGGILSVTLIQERYKEHKALPVMKDSLIYLAIAGALILIGAVVEVAL